MDLQGLHRLKDVKQPERRPYRKLRTYFNRESHSENQGDPYSVFQMDRYL